MIIVKKQLFKMIMMMMTLYVQINYFVAVKDNITQKIAKEYKKLLQSFLFHYNHP